MKTAVLLINLGTPDSPSTSDVRKYLFQFLNDPRVIDIPWLARKLLVNGIIVPFRAPKSAKIYKELWTDEGSPLLTYGLKIKHQLQQELGDDFYVEFGMRYKNPSVQSALDRIQKHNPDRIIILPLFPHYASSSTGSAIQEAMEIISKWWVIPNINIISQFYEEEGYIEAFAERGREHDIESYEHVLFSFHGLPVRQLDKVYDQGLCADHDCENEVTSENKFCYKAACYATARIIAAKLNIPAEKFTVAFQSRLGRDPWIQPYSDVIVEEKAKAGVKRMLVFSPAFVADCLETVVEIGSEYKEIFEEHGGEKLQLVESLNDHPLWVKTLKKMVLDQ